MQSCRWAYRLHSEIFAFAQHHFRNKSGRGFPCHSATPAEFYKGRTIPVIIGYSAGGGYDLYARVLSQYMGRHIPGNPTLLPQNMPGAGSIKAALYLFSVAPKDGSVIGTFARGMASTALIGDAKFDARRFTWLGSMTKDTTLCISWKESPIRTWNDAMTHQFTAGGEGAAGRSRHLRETVQERLWSQNPARNRFPRHHRCHLGRCSAAKWTGSVAFPGAP